MSRGIQKWTEEAIARLQDEGRGKGKGPTYQPWVRIEEMHSTGRTHDPYSQKTGRSHELLSDAEEGAFLMLDWAQDVIDIREQYPLPRDITREVAHELGLRHQCYPGTHVPFVMTLDFVATKVRNGEPVLEAFSVKVEHDLNDRKVLERLEIERETCQGMDMPYHILVKERMPTQKLRNLKWIRAALLKPGANVPYSGFYDEHMLRMTQDIAARRYDAALVDYCSEYDRRFSVEAGTGMRVVRMLLANRTLTMDLNNPAPERSMMENFRLSALPGRLRAVGGA